MSEPVNSPRNYDSTGRREHARQNRVAVLTAARGLFLERGYAATTMATIATEAGVSVETIYKGFVNKAGLLQTLFDVAVGFNEPTPAEDRELIDAVETEIVDPARKVRLYGTLLGHIAGRVQPLQLLARQAAESDPAAATVYEKIRNQRLRNVAAFADFLHENGHLRDEVTAEEARDVIWTYNSVEIWDLLVLKRGWAAERYGHWVGEALVAALLEPAGSGEPREAKR